MPTPYFHAFYVPDRRQIPANAHPFVQFVFERMSEQGLTYNDMEVRTENKVKFWAMRRWRSGRSPTLEEIEACLRVLGVSIEMVEAENAAD